MSLSRNSLTIVRVKPVFNMRTANSHYRYDNTAWQRNCPEVLLLLKANQNICIVIYKLLNEFKMKTCGKAA